MRIIVCIPGNQFTGRFLRAWTEFLQISREKGIEIVLSSSYSAVVHFARAQCLGADVMRGIDQKPFDGKVPYDYILWVDSDVLFTFEDFEKLLQSPHDVTCGLYRMANMKQFPVVQHWNTDFFQANGYFEFLGVNDLLEYREANKERYMKVDYAGMGFMLIRSGVIEKVPYPWFYKDAYIFEKGGKLVADMASEDVAFCKNLAQANIYVFVDTTVIVGHEKMVVL